MSKHKHRHKRSSKEKSSSSSSSSSDSSSRSESSRGGRRRSTAGKKVVKGLSQYGVFNSWIFFGLSILVFLGCIAGAIYCFTRTEEIVDDKGNKTSPKVVGGILLGIGFFFLIGASIRLWFVRNNKEGAAIVGGMDAIKQTVGALRGHN